MGAPNMDALAEQVVSIPVTRREGEGGAAARLGQRRPRRAAHRRRRRKIRRACSCRRTCFAAGSRPSSAASATGRRDFLRLGERGGQSNAGPRAASGTRSSRPRRRPTRTARRGKPGRGRRHPRRGRVETDDDGGEEEEEDDDDDARPTTPPPQAPVTATDWWGNLRQATRSRCRRRRRGRGAPRLGGDRACAPAEWRNSIGRAGRPARGVMRPPRPAARARARTR